jgi:sugar phosphate isomerase/epimerase
MNSSEWPIALSTGCFYKRPILDILRDVRDAGFRQVEVCSFPAHLDYHDAEAVKSAARGLRELEIAPVSFHAPFADRIDITAFDPAVREASVAELIRACESAALLGCGHVVLHPGPEREGRPPEAEFLQHMRHAAESLNLVAARCCELGIRLLLENMLAHLLFGRVSDMLYLLGEIKSCQVGTCLDTGHAHLAGELGLVVQKLSGHLRMIHINDNHGDRDAHLIPGEGGIDWPWLVSELRRHHFHGGLVIEMSAFENESVADTLARAQRGRDFLSRLTTSYPW